MKKNMGTADKIVRLILAAVIVILFATDVLPGVTGIILLIVAAIFALTSLVGTCPLYMIFGISTCKKESKK